MRNRFFSRKDGITIPEHLRKFAENLKAFFNALPAKIKAILPEAEDFVDAVETLAESLQEGHPINEAVERALALIPGQKDEAFYEAAKQILFNLATRLRIIIDEIKDGVQYEEGGSPALTYGSAKKESAVDLVLAFNDGKPTRIEAGVAVEVGVYALKTEA